MKTTLSVIALTATLAQPAATHDTAFFSEDVFLHPGVSNFKGAINIESTESGVFCSASITDAVGVPDYSFSLRLVRVNPHPGTVE